MRTGDARRTHRWPRAMQRLRHGLGAPPRVSKRAALGRTRGASTASCRLMRWSIRLTIACRAEEDAQGAGQAEREGEPAVLYRHHRRHRGTGSRAIESARHRDTDRSYTCSYSAIMPVPESARRRRTAVDRLRRADDIAHGMHNIDMGGIGGLRRRQKARPSSSSPAPCVRARRSSA